MKINEETGVSTIETLEEADRIREQIVTDHFEPSDIPGLWKATLRLAGDPPDARHIYLWPDSLMRRPMRAAIEE